MLTHRQPIVRAAVPRALLSIVLFAGGVSPLFVRFPPGDLAGWVAGTSNVTQGVPYLAASLLLYGAALVHPRAPRLGAFQAVSLVFAGVGAVAGYLLISMPI